MPITALRPSQALVDIVGALGGQWHGYVAMCQCPAHADTTPSLSLRQGHRGLLVTCFAGCEPSDILRELRRIPAGERFDRPRALISTGTANVERLWERASPVDQGLPARYLAQRHLGRPNDLRYLARCPLGPRPSTVYRPALLVAVRERNALVALQRIFLDPQTARRQEKLMLGRPGNGAWHGERPDHELAIAEGFETAVAFQRLHRVPTWSALGARRMHQLAIPPGIRTLILAEDNDAEGRRASARAIEVYSQPGITICRQPPPQRVKDWAQLLEIEESR
ncbi:DUF7146 domain-containing protein [Sphingomonas sp. NPDC019816]|jgi:hypothetical protein|uniref:Virulence-associated protein E n=2 Tax=Alphaproteobacteria TaxID=28211 RepID=A0A533I1H0_PARDE|nr:toprim domain-containing protein [Sphingomonas sp. ABOLF]RSV13926.1 virulence-associated protein E [Sphingomonas sp. ABOLF]TAJ29117.1 MAG: virulence-associated protein E [Bosea sp. (in: a-proteobacteria)]TKW63820.1 MAG: virulence-associated protein E [Paracoccus denitrificans]